MRTLKQPMRESRHAVAPLVALLGELASRISTMVLALAMLVMPPFAAAAEMAATQNASQVAGAGHYSVVVRTMRKIWIASAAFWMDNSHLIFSSSDVNEDWHLGDLPRIVVFDTDTQRIESTPYTGYLYCYSQNGMIVDAGKRAGKPVILTGKYGGSLREVEEHRRPTITGVDCQPISVDHGEVTIDLMPGDGKIRFEGGPAHIASEKYDVQFLGDDGTLRGTVAATLFTLPATNNFVFLPWARIYAREGAFGTQHGVAGSLVDPNARTIKPINAPAQLTGWADSNLGSGDVRVSKAGLLWRFRANPGRSSLQGLFLQTDTGLQRIDDHDVWAPSNISPDGCKLFYGRVAGDSFKAEPFKNRGSYDVVLLNVCQGAEQ